MSQVAVITGASSGIGAATARRLAKDGFHVITVARRAEKLAALAQEIGGDYMALDITSAESVAQLAKITECDVLVNNAGGALGTDSVATGNVDEWRQMYELNVLGTLQVIQTLMPALRSGDSGTIVNLTSTAGSSVYEGGGGYCASKYGQHALSETLRLELCGEPIRVIEIAPGMVQTAEFTLNRLHGDSEKAAQVYADVDRPLSAEDVADCIGLAVGLPSHVNVDQMTIRPLAQTTRKVHRGPLFLS